MPRRDLTWKNGLLPLRRLLRLGTLLALTVAGPQAHGQTSFQGLGFLSGGLFSTAIGMNADGTVVAGQSNSSSNPFQGVRWVNSTPTGLGWLPTYTIDSAATGINSNGTVLVGWSQNISADAEAFEWVNGTMTPLGFLSGQFLSSWAFGVSADGSVVVGKSATSANLNNSQRFEAVRWGSTA